MSAVLAILTARPVYDRFRKGRGNAANRHWGPEQEMGRAASSESMSRAVRLAFAKYALPYWRKYLCGCSTPFGTMREPNLSYKLASRLREIEMPSTTGIHSNQSAEVFDPPVRPNADAFRRVRVHLADRLGGLWGSPHGHSSVFRVDWPMGEGRGIARWSPICASGRDFRYLRTVMVAAPLGGMLRAVRRLRRESER
jgi:hypothetical protein